MAKSRLVSSSLMKAKNIGVAYLALLLSLAVLFLQLASVAPNGHLIAWFGLVLLMAGLFPLSAIAFGWLEVPGIIQQIKHDCKLLNTECRLDKLPANSAGRWNQSNYAIHYTLAIIATFLGVGLLFRDADKYLSNNALQAMQFGFLGAYVYCLNVIYRRYTTLDLQPHVYLYCAAGLTAGMVFNYVAFKAIDNVAAVNSATVASDPVLDVAKAGMADTKAATAGAKEATAAAMKAAANAMKLAADVKAATVEAKKATTADTNSMLEDAYAKATTAETAATDSVTKAQTADTEAATADTKADTAAKKVTAYPANKEFTGIAAAAAAILAFSLGYFPNLAIAWFGRLSYTTLNQSQRRSDALPLALIDGISELHETRLRDEGIDNIQNLATADIADLVEKTPFSAQEIVEWVDQAVLYLYLDPGEIASFRRAGARSVTDFGDLWRGYCVRFELQPDGKFKRLPVGLDSTEFDTRRKDIAKQLQTTEERMDALYHATEFGPNMHYVRTYWDSVEAIEARARVALVREVCGRVGCVLRTSERDGTATDGADVMKQVVRMLLSAVNSTAVKNVSHENTAAALYGQAVLNRLLDDDTEARRLYEQCIKEFPEDPTAFNDLAWLLLHSPKGQSQYDDAFKYALKAVKLANENPKYRNALPGYLDTLALAYIRRKQPKKALELIDEAMKAWPKSNPGSHQPKFLETLVSAANELVVQGEQQVDSKVLCRVLRWGYADETTALRARKLLQILALTLVDDAETLPPGKEQAASAVLRSVLDSNHADETTTARAKQLLQTHMVTLVNSAEMLPSDKEDEASVILRWVLDSKYTDDATAVRAKQSLQKHLATLVNGAEALPAGKEQEARVILHGVLDSKYADEPTAARAKQSLQKHLATLVNGAEALPAGKEEEAATIVGSVLDSKYADEPTAARAEQFLRKLLGTLVNRAEALPSGKEQEAVTILSLVLDSKYADEPIAAHAGQLLRKLLETLVNAAEALPEGKEHEASAILSWVLDSKYGDALTAAHAGQLLQKVLVTLVNAAEARPAGKEQEASTILRWVLDSGYANKLNSARAKQLLQTHLVTLVDAAEAFGSSKGQKARVILRWVLDSGYADETTVARAKHLLAQSDVP